MRGRVRVVEVRGDAAAGDQEVPRFEPVREIGLPAESRLVVADDLAQPVVDRDGRRRRGVVEVDDRDGRRRARPA
jgi:hypothetical protein